MRALAADARARASGPAEAFQPFVLLHARDALGEVHHHRRIRWLRRDAGRRSGEQQDLTPRAGAGVDGSPADGNAEYRQLRFAIASCPHSQPHGQMMSCSSSLALLLSSSDATSCCAAAS